MGAVAGLRCPRCDRESLSKTAFYCLECDSILEVHVDISHLVGAQFDTLRASRDHSIWRWFDFFPLQHRSSIVSLGEGDTPLIRARRLGAYLDLSNLYLKKRHCFADRIA